MLRCNLIPSKRHRRHPLPLLLSLHLPFLSSVTESFDMYQIHVRFVFFQGKVRRTVIPRSMRNPKEQEGGMAIF